MTDKSKLSAANSGSISKVELGFFAIAILALVVVSAMGYNAATTDSDCENTADDAPVFFVNEGIRYKVLSETDKTVAVTGYIEGNINADYPVVIKEEVTNSNTGITYKVTELAKKAFYGSKMTSVKISKNITSIDPTAFLSCSNLSKIEIDEDNSNYMVENGILYSKDHSKLVKYPENHGSSEFTVSGSTTVVGSYAFSGNVLLKTIKTEGTVPTVEDYAFYENTNLETFEEKGAKYIGKYAFSGCTKLSTVTFNGDTVAKTIGEYAFSGCSALSSLKLPVYLETIEKGVFQNCSSLVAFEVPKTTTSIDGSAFVGCTKISNFSVADGNGTYKIIKIDNHGVLYTTNNMLVVFPGAGIVHPKEDPFTHLHKDTTAILPYAFSSCTGPEFTVNVKDCTKLTEIGDYAFYGSTVEQIWTADLDRNIVRIGDYAFYECKNLFCVMVDVSNDFESIGEYAFYGCEKFSILGRNPVVGEFLIPNNASIAETAFIGCTKITKFRVSDHNLYTVHDDALFTKDLKRLVAYPAGKGATSFTLPAQTEQINPCAFVGLKQLTAIYVADDNTEFCSVDGVLYSYDMTTLIQYPAGKAGDEYTIAPTTTTIGDYAFAYSTVKKVRFSLVDSIGAYAFYNCKELTYADISLVSKIGEYAFCDCNNLGWGTSNATLVLGPFLTELDTGAFKNCVKIEYVFMQTYNPVSLNKDPFEGCNKSTMIVFVPNNGLDIYRSDESYMDFTSRNHIYTLVYEPVPLPGLVYNAKEQVPFVDEKFKLTGTTSATDVGNYVIEVTPRYEDGYVWDMDLGHQTHKISWSIAKLTLKYSDVSGVAAKQYDGTTTVNGNPGIVFANMPTGGNVTYNATYRYASADSGAWAIEVTGVELTGESSKNYQIDQTSFTSASKFTIEKRMLNVDMMKVDFTGERFFDIKDYATGVGEEKITLKYTTTDYVPGFYFWNDPDTGFEITYESPDGKNNYDFKSVNILVIDGKDITVTFDPDYSGQQAKSFTLSWLKSKYMVDRSELPTVPGQINLGWYDVSGKLVNFNEMFTDDGAVYKAKWQTPAKDMVIQPKETNSLDIDLTGQTAVETVKINFQKATVKLDVKGLSNKGIVTVSVENPASNANDIKLTVTSVGNWFKEPVTVSLPYEQRDSFKPVVYHYVGQEKEAKESVIDEEHKTITFSTLDYNGDTYGVEYVENPTPAPSQDDNTAFIIAAIVIVAILIGVGAYFYTKKRKA